MRAKDYIKRTFEKYYVKTPNEYFGRWKLNFDKIIVNEKQISLDDKISGKRSGVIQIAIATANVNAKTISCFLTFIINTSGIITSINLIKSLLIFSIDF